MARSLAAPRLTEALQAAGVAVTGVSIGILGIKSSYKVTPGALQGAAQSIISAFDDSSAADAAWLNIGARTSAAGAMTTDSSATYKAIRAAAAVPVDEINIILAAIPRGISTITRSGTTATATTPTAHGMSTGQSIAVFGADVAAYNGVKSITVTGATTFTYTVAGSPTTPATGSILYVLNAAAPPLARTLAQAQTAMQNKITTGVVD